MNIEKFFILIILILIICIINKIYLICKYNLSNNIIKMSSSIRCCRKVSIKNNNRKKK